MLSLRELLVYPSGNKYVIIGGNMRYRAMKQLGYTECPVKVIPEDTPADRLRAYMLRDNTHFGEWDFSVDAGFEHVDLTAAQIETPKVDLKTEVGEAVKRHVKSLHNDTTESRCDLKMNHHICFREDFAVVASFRKSEEGVPLSEIKTDENVNLFAACAAELVSKLIYYHGGGDWCIVSPPTRRHKEGNFAVKVCRELSKQTGIPYHEGFATAKTKQRIAPTFIPMFEIKEKNVILYDDIISTAATCGAMHSLLSGKNILTICGINNKG